MNKGPAPERTRRRTRATGKMRTMQEQESTGNKSNERRRRGISLKVYATAMVLLTVGVMVTLCLTVFFNIDKIEVSGETRYTSEEVVAASGLRQGDNLLLADLGTAQERIVRALPFLETAQIQRWLPTGIKIELTEATPALSVHSQEGYLILSTTGKVLAVQDQAQADTIVVTGAALTEKGEPGTLYERESDAMSAVWRLYNAFTETEMHSMLRSMDLSDPFTITLAYGEDITVDFGTSVQISEKLNVLRAVLETKAEPGKRMLVRVTATQATVKYIE